MQLGTRPSGNAGGELTDTGWAMISPPRTGLVVEALRPVPGGHMPEYRIGTREEWQAAREELARLEAEHAELTQKVTNQRRRLPWVPVEQEYEFDTEDGKKTLAELLDGRSQLLAYNINFGPDYELGACPGCTNLGDELDGGRACT
jgi:predicted dithiol-disulfide oxidoreductase (DUF899 family)